MPDRSTADEDLQPTLQNAHVSAESPAAAHLDESNDDRDTEPSIDVQILREALRTGVK